ncbi:hypothetical protein [Streptomyces sp. SID1121]|uniref:hypothetical protein n=1 Tax=Streptomyces sp. SID1121 TaxID=3425888 RepID=UPI0040579221
MNRTEAPSAEQVTRAVAQLSHSGLIRLISEIDDNGPIDNRMLGRTFTDLTRHQIRHALATGHRHGLIQEPTKTNPVHLLTHHGAELADVYDQIARWARSNDYPNHTSDFVTRVQGTLSLLAHEHVTTLANNAGEMAPVRHVPGPGAVPSTGAEGRHSARIALLRWIRGTPSLATSRAWHFSGVTHDLERAA